MYQREVIHQKIEHKLSCLKRTKIVTVYREVDPGEYYIIWYSDSDLYLSFSIDNKPIHITQNCSSLMPEGYPRHRKTFSVPIFCKVKIKLQTSKKIIYITEHFCGAQNEFEYAFESVTEVLFCQGIHLPDLHVYLSAALQQETTISF